MLATAGRDTNSAAAPQPAQKQHALRNVVFSSCAFVLALVLTHFNRSFDAPLTLWLNIHADHSRRLDQAFNAIDTYFTYSGVLLMSLIWACWFAARSLELWAALLMGTLVSGASAVVSRLLQHTLHAHLRPMYDPSLGFRKPSVFAALHPNTRDSFPSDHATVFAGLLAVLFLAHSQFRWPALLWLTLVESARTYAGVHYPSGLLGGAALGSLLVWIAQAPFFRSPGCRMAPWEKTSPGPFYLSVFFVSYQISTLTTDIRNAASLELVK